MCNSIDDPGAHKSSTSAFTHSALLKFYVAKKLPGHIFVREIRKLLSAIVTLFFNKPN